MKHVRPTVHLKYLIATIIIGRGDVSKKVARVEGEKKKIYHREGTKRRVINGEVLFVVDLTIV